MSEYKFLFKIINENKARMELSGTISESAKDAILTILTTADPDLSGTSKPNLRRRTDEQNDEG